AARSIEPPADAVNPHRLPSSLSARILAVSCGVGVLTSRPGSLPSAVTGSVAAGGGASVAEGGASVAGAGAGEPGGAAGGGSSARADRATLARASAAPPI